MNKENIRFNLYFVSRFLSQHVINTTLQAIQEEQRHQRRKSRSVRCHQEILPSSSLLFYIRSLAHATAVVDIVMADATVTRSLPPHHHQHLLRPRHSLTCWSGPRPLPSTGWRTDRWNPRTLMPLQGVIEATCAPSIVGDLAPTGLHRSLGLHHRVVRARQREEKKKTKPAASL
jgi:hypothetical protein